VGRRECTGVGERSLGALHYERFSRHSLLARRAPTEPHLSALTPVAPHATCHDVEPDVSRLIDSNVALPCYQWRGGCCLVRWCALRAGFGRHAAENRHGHDEKPSAATAQQGTRLTSAANAGRKHRSSYRRLISQVKVTPRARASMHAVKGLIYLSRQKNHKLYPSLANALTWRSRLVHYKRPRTSWNEFG